MVVCETCKIVYVNEDTASYVETDIVTKRGTALICPAYSLVYTYDNDYDGFPIYRIQDCTYGVVGDDGTSIVGTSELDNYMKLMSMATKIPGTLADFSRSTQHVVQFERHPITGVLTHCSVDGWVNGLRRQPKSIPLYRVKRHDRDWYTDEDVANHLKELHDEWQKSGGHDEAGFESYRCKHQKVFAGNPKAPHIHAVAHGALRDKNKGVNGIKASTMMRLLNVPYTCVYRVDKNRGKAGRGNDGFLDSCIYLEHKTPQAIQDEKFIYDDCFDYHDVYNFDLSQKIAERDANNAKYGMDNPTLLQKWKQDLLRGEKSLSDCYIEDIDLYADNIVKLERWRSDYLFKRAPMPAVRQTFYIEAESAQGGEGKSLATHALARSLAGEYGADTSLDYYLLTDYIFNINDSRVSMQNYDGQPIIVINDMKAGDMMAAFGGRRGVKELLDPFQESKASYNIKYGHCVVLAKYIIINGIQSSDEFKHDLAIKRDANDDVSEEKSLRQFERRIWGGLNIIDDKTIAVMFQRKLLEPTYEKYAYEEICRIRANWPSIRRQYAGQSLAIVENKILMPLIEQIKISEHANVLEKITDPDLIDPADLNPEILPAYGKISSEVVQSRKASTIAKISEEICKTARKAYEAGDYEILSGMVNVFCKYMNFPMNELSFSVRAMNLFDKPDDLYEYYQILDSICKQIRQYRREQKKETSE